ncbi:hypothetical protein [Phosphitispora fastidiosa]|uniref:hypothetical protein n=1 Tax=Phosphitispora fastidiosa TaxID=2837202 RepID=UPI001E37BE5A|nr:hypothetical protein [Phosphitispora fastidiosa]MBU7008848.1 hypothetical protein [Phosphitispora fastidiosa]
MKQGRKILFIFLFIMIPGIFVGCSNTQSAGQNQIESPSNSNDQQTEEDFIYAAEIKDTVDSLTLLDDSKIDIDQDGREESVELYTAAAKDPKGQIAWDDGQRWLLRVTYGDSEFILFDDYVQLGDLNYWLYTSEQNTVHITTIQNCDADFLFSDNVFDKEKKRFERKVVFRPYNVIMSDYSRY